MEKVLMELQKISRLLETQNLLQKEVLNFNEACDYTGLSQSHMYKITSVSGIAFYKPGGKKVYFKRSDLDSFLLRNRVCTIEELDEDATSFIKKPKP